jgi:hypothetical protein
MPEGELNERRGGSQVEIDAVEESAPSERAMM